MRRNYTAVCWTYGIEVQEVGGTVPRMVYNGHIERVIILWDDTAFA